MRVVLLVLTVALAACGVPEKETRRPNVLIYLVDTLRADRLGCYGYERETSPRIDAFARQAVLFENAVAQSSWTRPSVASLFTGQLPATHGVRGRRHKVPDEAVTLAELLREAGYETLGYVTNPNVSGRFGFRQGFDTFHAWGKKRATAVALNAAVKQWFDERASPDAPFFVYLHTVEPHGPYQPPEPFRERLAPDADPALGTRKFLRRVATKKVEVTPDVVRKLSHLYDAEIATNDAAFGELLDFLRDRGVWDDTLVVFVSDHGDELYEHGGWEHSKTLYTEVIDIPLIIRFPDISPRRFAALVQHADLMPTLAAYLGLDIPEGVEGRNLLPWLEDPRLARGSFVTSDVQRAFKGRSVTTRQYRYILPESKAFGSGEELYDRRTDPGEKHNVAASSPEIVRNFRAVLDAMSREPGAVPEVDESELDPEMVEQLKALGYLE